MLGAQGEGQNDDERDSSNRHRCVAFATYRLRAWDDHDEDECDHRGEPCKRHHHAEPEQDVLAKAGDVAVFSHVSNIQTDGSRSAYTVGCARRPSRSTATKNAAVAAAQSAKICSKKILWYTPRVKAGHHTRSEVATVMAASRRTPGPPGEPRAKGPAAQAWHLILVDLDRSICCRGHRGGQGPVELAGDVALEGAAALTRCLALGGCAGRYSGGCGGGQDEALQPRRNTSEG